MGFKRSIFSFVLYILVGSPAISFELPQDKILFVLLDGVQESLFRSLLESGKLPHFQSLLERKTDSSGRSGIYTAATSVWPTTSGVAYVPFIAGIFPEKAGLVGVRQYQRDQMEFRTYAGFDMKMFSRDLTKDYPLIYEVLEEGESFSQVGMVTRKGWKKSGSIYRAVNENFTSVTALINQLRGDVKMADFYNVVSYLNEVSSQGDRKRLQVFKKFQGVFFPWGSRSSESFWEENKKSFRLLGKLPAFSFISLHSPDHTGHQKGVREDYVVAIETMDELVGALLDVFKAQGQYEKLTVIISSDHGMSSVNRGKERNFNVAKALTRDTGVRIYGGLKRFSYFFNKLWKPSTGVWNRLYQRNRQANWDGVYAVSGNANAQFYIRKPGALTWKERPSYQELRHYQGGVDLVGALLKYKQVDKVYLRGSQPGQTFIFKNGGQSEIRVQKKRGERTYRYQVIKGKDPLGYDQHRAIRTLMDSQQFFSGNEWARLSKETDYPDGLVQIVQLLNSKSSGDIVIDAKKGYEPWDEMQRGTHGSLHKDHMLVPLIISSPRLDYRKAKEAFTKKGRYPRTVDLYPTMLSLLNLSPPKEIWWRREGKYTKKSVRNDIDGVDLKIWVDQSLASNQSGK